MSFYVKNKFEYYSMKRKCPKAAFVQPITMKNKHTYSVVRLGSGFFEPGMLNLYFKNVRVHRIRIEKKWMLKELSEFCKKSIIREILYKKKSKIISFFF